MLLVGAGLVLLWLSIDRAGRVASGLTVWPIPLLFGLAALGVLSLAWTPASFPDAISSALTPAVYAAVALAVFSTGRSEAARIVVPWIAGFSLVAAGSGFAGVLNESEPWAVLLDGHWRAAGFFEYPPALAFVLLAGLPAWVMIAGKSRGLARGGAGVAFAICAGCLILTGSRVTLVLAAGLVLVVLWARRQRPRQADRTSLARRAWKPVLAAALVLAVALAATGLPGTSPGGRQGDSGPDHGRFGLWQDSFPAIGDSPLYGHGSGSYFDETRADQRDATLYAHSLPVETAVELGLPAAVLASLILVSSLAAIWSRRASRSAFVFGAAVAAFAVLALTDWIWHMPGVGSIWAVMLGSLLATPPRGPEISLRRYPPPGRSPQ